MGQNVSINLNSYQKASNDISQISNENCINLCTDDTNIILNMTDFTAGNITIKTGCFINSPSCILKSSMDSSLINNLKSEQDGSITSGAFAFLDDLAELGSSKSINESNYQETVNKVTQQLNSLCMSHNSVSGDVLLNMDEGSVKNLIIDKTKNGTNKSQCVIENMAKSFVQNDLTNKQKASISTGTIGLGMLALLAIVAIIMLRHRKKHKKSEISDLLNDNPGNSGDLLPPMEEAALFA